MANSWPPRLDDSMTGTPARRSGSVRRTAHIDMIWPELARGHLQLRGRSRDLLTPTEGAAAVIGEAWMDVEVGEGRTIESITVSPVRPDAAPQQLVGAKGGSMLRTAIDEAFPGERLAATPLHFLLDDIAGTSLIAGFALIGASPDDEVSMLRRQSSAEPMGIRKGRVICSGLRPGGYAQELRLRGERGGHLTAPAGDLTSDDPHAWHAGLEPLGLGAMRRRRRVDVWRVDDTISVDAHFRDSFWGDDGAEMALHEYSVEATVDLRTREVSSVSARPRVLPFPECPLAADHVSQVVGRRIDTFRTSVQSTLRELEACTHLNDMLRCLAEVAALAEHVDARGG